jgi:hypothetical protein
MSLDSFRCIQYLLTMILLGCRWYIAFLVHENRAGFALHCMGRGGAGHAPWIGGLASTGAAPKQLSIRKCPI